jgi:DnaJ-domain-containing protein 1
MQTNTRIVQKTAILVEISLADGSVVLGKIFVPHQGRLTDVLNDDRNFLPVEGADGTTFALAKTAIKQVSLPVAEAAAYRGINPYLVLGVKEGISPEELKKAYHQLSLVNHPDRIRGFGLGEEYLELATRNMARINSAYAQILKRMGS